MNEQLSKKGLIHLFIVYTVWSSTYLAIFDGGQQSVGRGRDFTGDRQVARQRNKAFVRRCCVSCCFRNLVVGSREWIGSLGRTTRRFRILLPDGIVSPYLGHYPGTVHL